ncbi:hypothetical protein PSP6_470022 [Paraburkholderia tropica]|nr:hypothetical protein PSP6_470022 [Paraburkholderia tropica]
MPPARDPRPAGAQSSARQAAVRDKTNNKTTPWHGARANQGGFTDHAAARRNVPISASRNLSQQRGQTTAVPSRAFEGVDGGCPRVS